MKNDLLIPAIAWILLTIICVTIILIGLKAVLRRTSWEKARQQKIFLRTTIYVVAWMLLLSILSINGFFADFTSLPPRPALAILIPLPVIFIIAFSKPGAALLTIIPQHWIIYMQSFRIAVELLLMLAFINGKIPEQMTFEGRNFDILTGILALPVGYLLAKRATYAPKLAIAFNIIGLLLLINILVIAVLSMPTSIRYFMDEPSNTLVGQFPFILLPGVLVPLAYTLHILSLRKLLAKSKEARLAMN